MAATGREPVTLPANQRLPVGEAPTSAARPLFAEARDEFAPPTLAELLEQERTDSLGGSMRSEYFDAESHDQEESSQPSVQSEPARPRGLGARLRGLFG